MSGPAQVSKSTCGERRTRYLGRVASAWGKRSPLAVVLGLAGVAGFAVLIGFLTAPQIACNDGSTGCCIVCSGTCPCGDVCAPCGDICTKVHGCACSEATAALQAPDASAQER